MDDLLAVVAQAVSQSADDFSDGQWRLTRIYGGMNGIIYRAENPSSPDGTLAVKIRKRDERGRAMREFAALQALQHLSPPVAPKPFSIHTNRSDLPGDVVITSWVEGRVLGDLAETSIDQWDVMLTTFARIHAIQPADAPQITDAVVPIRSTIDLIAEIERRYARLPDGQIGTVTKADIGKLFEAFKVHALANAQPAPRIGLIACDMNPSNLIEHGGHIVLVDWESSGWGDPAFDIADLLVRLECAALTSDTRDFILWRYGELTQSPPISNRILAYERLMLIFWLILTSNGFAATQVQRLAGARTFTLEETTRQQQAYLERITQAQAD